jgi:DNA invertase Pin-like site-specific DNA recombinase
MQIMNGKIQLYHQQKTACVYLRQSTMFQVMHNQESTERQYALRQKALDCGWDSSLIQLLDGDMGRSGSHTTGREDFKSLVAEVSMGNVGAIFVLEASRLSRSSADWNRLLELCSLTQTLIIDQDGCYDPAQFNDQLLLGLKGTMSQAELRLIRGRLHGAKVNKAKKGELRFAIPVGYMYDQDVNIVFDQDAQVCHIIQLVFDQFREKQSVYGVVQFFGASGIRFPKRSYGGRWKGKLLWGRLSYERALSILSHPFYAGVYTFGRYKNFKHLDSQGEIVTRQRRLPMEQWTVMIKDHHPQYITYDEFEKNVQQCQLNKTNSKQNPLSGPPREGATLLQGILYCGVCGRGMTIRYTGKEGTVPTYECNWRKKQGLTGNSCFSFRADITDPVIERAVIDVLTPANVSIAINALGQIEKRNTSLNKQWEMNIQRCQYQADIAQRRFEQVDPANRLVAASLEKSWNLELEKLALANQEYIGYQHKQAAEFPSAKKQEITELASAIPSLWQQTDNIKDKKRIIRLLVSDITVTRDKDKKLLFLNLRWQAGPVQQFQLNLRPNISEILRYPKDMVEKVRELTLLHGNDRETAMALNQQGILSATGKPFTQAMIKWIRRKHHIDRPVSKAADELTVAEGMKKFGASMYMVYYWIDRKYIQARKSEGFYLIKMSSVKEAELGQLIQNSYKANAMANPPSR